MEHVRRRPLSHPSDVRHSYRHLIPLSSQTNRSKQDPRLLQESGDEEGGWREGQRIGDWSWRVYGAAYGRMFAGGWRLQRALPGPTHPKGGAKE